MEVLLPFAVRDNLGGGAEGHGLAILVPRLDRDEVAHPLDHPTAKP
jgi:hypothetical protein